MRFVLVTVLSLLLAAAPSMSFGDETVALVPAAERFELQVKFETPITRSYTLKAVIVVGEAFLEKAPHEGGSFNLASGMLLPAVEGKYPLVLTYIDWGSEKNNTMSASKLTLTPDKPESFGMSGALIHMYTITLARVKQ